MPKNLRIPTSQENNVVSAFWSNPKSKAKKITLAKKIWKFVWRMIKLSIFTFLIVLGLWGCVSLWVNQNVIESTIVGQGFEFGLPSWAQGAGAYQYQTNYIGTGTYYTMTLGNWTNAYGPFYGYFVYPGCALVILIMWSLKGAWGGLNALFAIIILLAIIRSISVVVSVRSAIMSEKMQELNAQIADIRAKYKGARDAQSKQMQQTEIQQVYKKNKVKQSVMFEQIAITLPVFLIVYRVVTILRPFKYTNLFNIWNLSDAPYQQIFDFFTEGGWVYLILLIIVIPIMVVSQILPTILSKKRQKNSYSKALLTSGGAQRKKSGAQNLMIWGMPIISVIFSIFLPSGVAVYWVINAIFSIIQAVIIHKVILKRRRTVRSDETKRKRWGLNF